MNSNFTRLSLSVSCILFFILVCLSCYAQTILTCAYSQMASITSGSRTAHVLAVDLNKDGLPDIVGTNQGGMDVTKGTISVTLGDLQCDGKIDVLSSFCDIRDAMNGGGH